MKNELFCAVCGVKKECASKYLDGGICPNCGTDTYFVRNISKWVYINSNKRGCQFFFIETNRGGQSWVEIYEGEEKYNKLVNALLLQKDVTVIKNGYGTLNYSRGGHKFQIILIRYVDYLLAQYDLWDGNPYIEFGFVEKNRPDFEVYREELQRICNLL